MLKNYRKYLTAGVLAFGLAACGDDVTITEPAPPPPPPETPNIVSFSVAPTNATIAVGQTVQASYNLQTKAGVAGTVAFASANAAVATVNPTSGLITAVTNGTALISATATAGGQTAVAQIGITVRNLLPAQISIQSVTQFANTVPVPLNNVNGQIEVNMNFNPGEQTVDSVNVFIGSRRAAKQAFATNPAAGIISLSVNTANFVKNTTTGVATVDYQNGASTISAAVYPRGGAATATNTIAVVLNNQDGWAADMSAPSAFTNNAGGLTYWGGPTAGGLTTATVYPVIYTPGRSIQTVSFNVGGCANFVDTSLPFRATFGSNAAATSPCTYEYTGGQRDDVAVTSAIDNTNNPFPLTPLIANVIVPGSTPDSLRFDWAAPSVATPSITRTAPAVTGWVNAAFNFINFASTDNGVGIRATRDRATSYTSPNCGGGAAVAMPNGTGADIPECASNFIGGAVGLGSPGTAPYRVTGTESDRLGNVGTSSMTQTFGVDKTLPSIRQGTAEAPLVAVTAADRIFSTKIVGFPTPAPAIFRAEFLDERSGFSATAQAHALSLANHANNVGICLVGTFPTAPGAAFVTAPTCAKATATLGALRLDGWQAGQEVAIPDGEGYYGYATNVTDAAGNTSAEQFRKVVVNATTPFASVLAVTSTLTNASFNFLVAYADSVEVINHSLALEYPNVPAVTGLRYSQAAIGTAFDNVITSPFNGTNVPQTGAPFVRSLEVVDASVYPAANVPAVYAANVKPTGVQAWGFNVANGTSASPLAAISPLLVQDGAGIAAYNTANPTATVGHWRVIPTVATTNQFGSTVRLRAHTVAPITNSVNAPFVRVDFYRLDGGGLFYNYLGSDLTGQLTDVGLNRSWLYDLTQSAAVVGPPAVPALFSTKTWNGTNQTGVISGDRIIAIGVLANGDAISTLQTLMP
jgi:hypothetical protein